MREARCFEGKETFKHKSVLDGATVPHALSKLSARYSVQQESAVRKKDGYWYITITLNAQEL